MWPEWGGEKFIQDFDWELGGIKPFVRRGVGGKRVLEWIIRKQERGAVWIYLVHDKVEWRVTYNAIVTFWSSGPSYLAHYVSCLQQSTCLIKY